MSANYRLDNITATGEYSAPKPLVKREDEAGWMRSSQITQVFFFFFFFKEFKFYLASDGKPLRNFKESELIFVF